VQLRIFIYYDVQFLYYGGIVQDEEVRKQLASLRAEVQALGNDLHRLRREDVHDVFSDQVRSVLEEKVQQHFASAKSRGRSGCNDPARCAIEITAFVAKTLAAYKDSGQATAAKVVQEFLEHLAKDRAKECRNCAEFKRSIAADMRNYLEISMGFDQYLAPDSLRGGLAKPSAARPEEVEAFLAPLSNSVRVRLLLLLREEELSLAEMSRRTDLKKGHLQFHLRPLTEAGLVDFNSRTKIYGISAKGGLALNGILALMERIGPELDG
jgi:DNA-binding transcriptional ArsR family regulator